VCGFINIATIGCRRSDASLGGHDAVPSKLWHDKISSGYGLLGHGSQTSASVCLSGTDSN